MSLNQQDISRIANLARLELQPDEEARMLNKINDFFGIVEQIRAVDTTGVVPMAHPVDAMQGAHIELRLRPTDGDRSTRPSAPSVPRRAPHATRWCRAGTAGSRSSPC